MTISNDRALLKSVYTKIRTKRAVLQAIEDRKPRGERTKVTWQQVYDRFHLHGEPMEAADFQTIVEMFSGQTIDPAIVNAADAAQ